MASRCRSDRYRIPEEETLRSSWFPTFIMTLSQQLTELAMKLRTERAERWKIEGSEEYKSFQSLIETSQEYLAGLQEDQKELLSVVPDSTEDYETLKRMVLGEMRDKGLETLDNVEAKIKIKREVNTRKVMEALGGDLDNFYILAKIQQNSLKSFTDENPEYKSIMKNCVDEVGREYVDLTVTLPEWANSPTSNTWKRQYLTTVPWLKYGTEQGKREGYTAHSVNT